MESTATVQNTRIAMPESDFVTAPASLQVRLSRDMFEFADARLWMEGDCFPSTSLNRQVVGIVQMAGASTIRQHSRSAKLQAGQFSLVDPSHSFTMTHSSAFRQLHLFIPATHFSGRELAIAAARASDWQAMVDDTSCNVWLVFGTPHQRSYSINKLPPAAALHALLSITTPFQSSAKLGLIDVRVQRALQFIEGRLCSELLTASLVSEAQKLSRRHLDDLFLKSVGLRVERWIWERRLSRAEQALRAPHFGSRSLLQLALDLGFKSPSHFSRAFANRFGVAPRKYRRRHQVLTPAANSKSLQGNGTHVTPPHSARRAKPATSFAALSD